MRFVYVIFKIIISFLLYYSGILFFLLKLSIKKGLYIFNYHSFNTFVNDYWKLGALEFSNYKDNFERQIKFFNKNFNKIENFKLFKLDEYSYKNPTYFLSFDDGYKDNFDIAFPILKKYSVPAIFFVTTSVIGSNNLLWFDRIRLIYEMKKKRNIIGSIKLKKQCNNEIVKYKKLNYDKFRTNLSELEKSCHKKLQRIMMNWNEIEKLKKEGFIIGSHTHTHPILARLNYDQQMDEIKTSVDTIKKILGFKSVFFSYPEGIQNSYNKETIDILKKIGIKFSFTTYYGINNEYTSPYQFKRIGINPSDPVPIVALKVIRENLRNLLEIDYFQKIGLKLKQYGFFNLSKRAIKRILKKLGIHFECYYILNRSIDEDINSFFLKKRLKMKVKKISYTDFEESEFFNIYPQSKIKIYKKRFSDSDFQAFAAEMDNKLVYITWIGINFLRIQAINFEKKLDKSEGALVDSFTLPEARCMGIHSFMNSYRLRRLKEMGIKKVYAAVLKGNRPALKTQLNHGFTRGEEIIWFKLGRIEKYFVKKIYFE